MMMMIIDFLSRDLKRGKARMLQTSEQFEGEEEEIVALRLRRSWRHLLRNSKKEPSSSSIPSFIQETKAERITRRKISKIVYKIPRACLLKFVQASSRVEWSKFCFALFLLLDERASERTKERTRS